MFGYTIIKQSELEKIMNERTEYFNRWMTEHHRINELVLKGLEAKEQEKER